LAKKTTARRLVYSVVKSAILLPELHSGLTSGSTPVVAAAAAMGYARAPPNSGALWYSMTRYVLYAVWEANAVSVALETTVAVAAAVS
jgi:hypothetical protein